MILLFVLLFFFKQKTAYEMRISDWSSDVCSSDLGDPSLKSERSWGAELFVRHQGENASLELSAFKSWFSNYIDQIATGAVEDELPVYQYVQGRARYWGVEAQGSATLARDRKSTRLNYSH